MVEPRIGEGVAAEVAERIARGNCNVVELRGELRERVADGVAKGAAELKTLVAGAIVALVVVATVAFVAER